MYLDSLDHYLLLSELIVIFIGRKLELQFLEDKYHRGWGQLIVLYGRRRGCALYRKVKFLLQQELIFEISRILRLNFHRRKKSRNYILFCFYHSIAYAYMCLNILRRIWQTFNLFPQGSHKHS